MQGDRSEVGPPPVNTQWRASRIAVILAVLAAVVGVLVVAFGLLSNRELTPFGESPTEVEDAGESGSPAIGSAPSIATRIDIVPADSSASPSELGFTGEVRSETGLPTSGVSVVLSNFSRNGVEQILDTANTDSAGSYRLEISDTIETKSKYVYASIRDKNYIASGRASCEVLETEAPCGTFKTLVAHPATRRMEVRVVDTLGNPVAASIAVATDRDLECLEVGFDGLAWVPVSVEGQWAQASSRQDIQDQQRPSI